jgi:hypothetical protein
MIIKGEDTYERTEHCSHDCVRGIAKTSPPLLLVGEPRSSLGLFLWRSLRRKERNMATNGNGYDYDLSAIVAVMIEAEPWRCWRNAALAVFLLSDLFAAGSYVEGWIVVPRKKSIAIIEHGWSTTLGRGIIDPSIILTEKESQPICYFSGYEISRDELCGRLSGSALPLIRHSSYGTDGMEHHGYHAAYTQAWLCARKLAEEKQLPQTAIQVSGWDSQQMVTILLS